jgi:hypothetical protein
MTPAAHNLGTREKLDGREPDPTRDGIFRDHNCWRCRSGELPCATQKPGREYLCEYPHARND